MTLHQEAPDMYAPVAAMSSHNLTVTPSMMCVCVCAIRPVAFLMSCEVSLVQQGIHGLRICQPSAVSVGNHGLLQGKCC